MRYPVISTSDLERLSEELRLDPTSADVARVSKWVGEGQDLDLSSFAAAADEMRALVEEEVQRGDLDVDQIEGAASRVLFDLLAPVPLPVLDDPGFWRYLSAAHLWWFIAWRQAGALKKDFADFRAYIDGRNQAECVPLRMYLRARIATDVGDPGLASAAPGATDIWRSHIVRVRTSYVPALAGAYIRQQADAARRLNTDDVREQAKRLNRLNSNVVILPADATQADRILEELR